MKAFAVATMLMLVAATVPDAERTAVATTTVLEMPASGASTSSTAVPLQLTGEECVLNCWTGVPSCEEMDQHDAWWADPEGHSETGHNMYSAGSHAGDCWDDSCEDKHPICGGGQNFALAEFEPLRIALQEGRLDAVRAQVAQYGEDVISINRERGAVQIIGCDGLIAAHLPAPDMLVAN